MQHSTPLITTIVAGFVLAFIFGAIANRFRMPPLVGYLVAGILVGPYTPGFVADQSLALELSEIGVILLMFGVGLHFSLKDLMSVRLIAVPGAIVQIGFATLLGWGFGVAMGWPTAGSLIFGLALSVASTVVLLKALQERRLVDSDRGRIAVGWLIVEDLAMVLALVLIPAAVGIADGKGSPSDPLAVTLSSLVGIDLGLTGVIVITLLKVAAFVAFMLVVGRRVIPWILHRIAHSGSRELFRLGVLAIALGVAFGAAQLFGVSLALGAFFAGMVLAESELSHRAAQESLPLRDAFAVLFFVSVGMLFDPSILLSKPMEVLAVVMIIVAGKSLAAFLIVLAFRKSVGTALTISASLAQIGEFSFILAEVGVGLKVMPSEARDLILAGAIISIILNPVMFALCDAVRPFLEIGFGRNIPKPTPAPRDDLAAAETGEVAASASKSNETVQTVAEADDAVRVTRTQLANHIIVVGFGRVGSLVAKHLKDVGASYVVIEDADKRLAEMKAHAIQAISGNAANHDVLALANLAAAATIMVAIPDAFEAGQVIEQARAANPAIRIIGRAHSDAEVEHLLHFGANAVIMGEREIAKEMIANLELKVA